MYKKSVDEVTKLFRTDSEKGLTLEDVQKRREECGYNELQGKKKQSFIVKFLMQFKDVLIIILILAAVISLIIDPKEWIESLIIFIVIMANAIIGVMQEDKAEKSLEALEKMSSPLCKVLRDGKVNQLATRELVTGDVIVIEAGDYIPADARIIECSNLQVDESALTGESVPVIKQTETIDKNDIPVGDMKNLVFSSTFVTKGRGKAIVTETGMNTRIGKIANMLNSDDNQKTPLQEKLAQVGKVIGIICIFICVIVFVLEYVRNNNFLESFKSAVALAVAAIPEGLATVVTIVLAIGVSNMAKQNAICKKLPAVETLGSTSIVCSDKTGTLTQNKMTVLEVYRNEIRKLDELDKDDIDIISYFALCSDARINFVDGKEERIGDPTETALIELNNKHGKSLDNIKRLADVPFDSERKMMSVICKMEDGNLLLITKGAPDNIIRHSKQSDSLGYALQINDNMAVRALRVLGLGIKKLDKMPDVIDESLEDDLTFIGLVGMIDPSRPEVKDAIVLAKQAGIRTIMITGDHITTATAIAKDLGIMEEGYKSISSQELSKMSDEELFNNIETYAVYARVAPEDKVRIIDAWQKKGKVVSMTGDGVNDSPALKKSDIGCAMGITGTDVAKEAADMILVDDNFATIISAVKQGRGIYANVKKCVKYLLSSNIGEVLTIFLASVLAIFFSDLAGVPLQPIHLLWINLITDSLPAFGLGMEKPNDDVMKDKPRPKSEGFFANKLGLHIFLEGIVIGLLTLSSYAIGKTIGTLQTAQTMAFLTLSGCQLFHAYNVKTDGTLLSKKTFNNKFLNMAFIIGFVLQFAVIYIPGINNVIFDVEALSFTNVLISIGLAFTIVIVMEIFKLFGYRKRK